MAKIRWIALNYNLPTEPSKNRVYVWRKLKELGAMSISHGVAVLPKFSGNVPELVVLCEKVKDLGGEAAILEMNFVNGRDEELLVQRFQKHSGEEYRALTAAGERILKAGGGSAEISEEMNRIIRQYRKARARDHFGAPGRAEVDRILLLLVDDCARRSPGCTRQVKKWMEKIDLR